MSADKYPSIFWPQMATIVEIYSPIFKIARVAKKYATNIRAYFRAKWRLLFIYTMLYKYAERRVIFLRRFNFCFVLVFYMLKAF